MQRRRSRSGAPTELRLYSAARIYARAAAVAGAQTRGRGPESVSLVEQVSGPRRARCSAKPSRSSRPSRRGLLAQRRAK